MGKNPNTLHSSLCHKLLMDEAAPCSGLGLSTSWSTDNWWAVGAPTQCSLPLISMFIDSISVIMYRMCTHNSYWQTGSGFNIEITAWASSHGWLWGGGCPLKAVMSLFSVKVSAMPLHSHGCQEGLALKKKMTFLETYPALRGRLYSATYTVSHQCQTSSHFAQHICVKIPDVTRVGIKALRGNMNTSFKCK